MPTFICGRGRCPAPVDRQVRRSSRGQRPKPYSQDFSDRVIDAVERGEMSRRAAARRYAIGKSVAIKWLERVERDGSARACGHGQGHRASRLMPHRDFLQAARTDVTLQALCDRLSAERGVKADTSMMSRFFRKIGVTFPRNLFVAREQDRADISRHRARWRAYQGRIDPRRLIFIDETWTKTRRGPAWRLGAEGAAPRRQGPAGQSGSTRSVARRAPRLAAFDAPACPDGPIIGRTFPRLDVEQFLVPTLKPATL